MSVLKRLFGREGIVASLKVSIYFTDVYNNIIVIPAFEEIFVDEIEGIGYYPKIDECFFISTSEYIRAV